MGDPNRNWEAGYDRYKTQNPDDEQEETDRRNRRDENPNASDEAYEQWLDEQ